MTWIVYRWHKGQYRKPGRRELLGTVEGNEWGAAHAAAAERWPEDAPPQPNYPKGRLVLREQPPGP